MSRRRPIDVIESVRGATTRRRFLKLMGGTLVVTPPLTVVWDGRPEQPAANGPEQTAWLTDPRYVEHDPGPGHPEQPARMRAILSRFDADGLADRLTRLRPRAITDTELATCHDRGYVELVEREVAAGAAQLSTGDTRLSAASMEIARLAAGAALVAIDAVVEGRASNAFCATRPPGHHALRDRGMGFCIFNNVALAARYAQRRHGVAKVAIIDWDVHHGNGTQAIFYEDPSVHFFSTHQSPWYPYTGEADETGSGAGAGTTMNVPLPAGAGRVDVYGAMQDRLLPALQRFRPELLLISAGFDSKLGDPLGRFELIDQDFIDMTRLLMRFADGLSRSWKAATASRAWRRPSPRTSTR